MTNAVSHPFSLSVWPRFSEFPRCFASSSSSASLSIPNRSPLRLAPLFFSHLSLIFRVSFLFNQGTPCLVRVLLESLLRGTCLRLLSEPPVISISFCYFFEKNLLRDLTFWQITGLFYIAGQSKGADIKCWRIWWNWYRRWGFWSLWRTPPPLFS